MSRGAPVLKKRGQKSRGTRLDYIVAPAERTVVCRRRCKKRHGAKRGVGRVAHRLVQGSTDITLHPQPNRRGNRKGE